MSTTGFSSSVVLGDGNFGGKVSEETKKWFEEVKKGNAVVTLTRGTETKKLELDPAIDARGGVGYYTSESLLENSVRFGAEKPKQGDVYTIKVEGYKTVKLTNTSDKNLFFNKNIEFEDSSATPAGPSNGDSSATPADPSNGDSSATPAGPSNGDSSATPAGPSNGDSSATPSGPSTSENTAPEEKKVVVKAVKISGQGLTGENGVYEARLEAGKSLNLTSEVLDANDEKLTGTDGEYTVELEPNSVAGINVDTNSNPIAVNADANAENNATVKLIVKSKKDPSIKSEITVIVYQLKTPEVSVSFGTLSAKKSAKDWVDAIKAGKAKVTVTNASGKSLTLTYKPGGPGSNVNNTYEVFSANSFEFYVDGTKAGDVFAIEVEGYKTVKVVANNGYVSARPSFNKPTIE